MADIASLVFTVGRVAGHLYFFLRDARGANQELEEFLDKVCLLQSTVRNVRDAFLRHPATDGVEEKNRATTFKLLKKCEDDFKRLETILPRPTDEATTFGSLKIHLQQCLCESTVKDIITGTTLCLSALQVEMQSLTIFQRERELNVSHTDIQREWDTVLANANRDLRDRPFINGDPDWDQCLNDFVSSIQESATTSGDRSTGWVLPQSPRDSSPRGSPNRCRRRSSGASSQTLVPADPPANNRPSNDSGYVTLGEQLEDILEEEDEIDPTRIPRRVVDRTLAIAISKVEVAIREGNLRDAVMYQRRIPRYRRLQAGDSPVDTIQACQDEIKLASIYQMTGRPALLKRAEETLTRALQRVQTEDISPPQLKASLGAKVSHSLGRVYLELGNTKDANEHLWEAWNQLTEPLNDVESPNLDDNQAGANVLITPMGFNIGPLVQSVGTMLYRISMQDNKAEIAESIDSVALEQFGFSLKTLNWCQDAGFDTEHEAFRFDVLCQREGSKVKGISPLHHAAKECQVELMAHMLREPMNIEVRDAEMHATPFLVACSKQDSQAVDLLLQHKAKADVCDKDFKNGLHLCQGKEGGTKVAERLLDLDAVRIDARDAMCKTALCMAAEMANKEMINLLCRKGAPVDAGGPNGFTPLMAAVEAKMPNQQVKEDILITLLQHGADPTLKCLGKTATETANDRTIKKLLEAWTAKPVRRFSLRDLLGT